MALDTTQRNDAARQLIKEIFIKSNITANLNHSDIVAAIGSIDDTFDATANTLTGAQTVAVNFNSRLPEPFKSTATVAQKSLAVAFVAMKRGGFI